MHVCMYVRMYVCMYVCMHVCTYLCMRVYLCDLLSTGPHQPPSLARAVHTARVVSAVLPQFDLHVHGTYFNCRQPLQDASAVHGCKGTYSSVPDYPQYGVPLITTGVCEIHRKRVGQKTCESKVALQQL